MWCRVLVTSVVLLALPACARRGPAHPGPSISFCRQLISVDARAVRCDAAVSDLAPLTALTRLEELVIASDVLSDLQPLAGLTHLRRLDVAGSRVADVSALFGLPRLERVNLSGTSVPHDQVEALIHQVPGCRVLTEVWSEPAAP